jgi:hypothetical protein
MLEETLGRWRPRPSRITISLPREGVPNLGSMAEGFQHNAVVLGMIEPLAQELGVTPSVLRRLAVGWNENARCWTFPLRDASLQVVGLNQRFRNGDKRVMQGHHVGLYIPIDLPADLSGHTLLVCEGGSDTAAALDMGFWPVGRFSCSTCEQMLVELVGRTRPAGVVIVADSDGPGRDGAASMAFAITPRVASCRIIEPPEGYKDLRCWLQGGAKPEDVVRNIDAARPRRLSVEVRQG